MDRTGAIWRLIAALLIGFFSVTAANAQSGLPSVVEPIRTPEVFDSSASSLARATPERLPQQNTSVADSPEVQELRQQLDELKAQVDAMRAPKMRLASVTGAPDGEQTFFERSTPAAQNTTGAFDPDQTFYDKRISALENDAKAVKAKIPLIKLGGFFQLDDGLFSQDPVNRATLGNIQDGIGFRRARLQTYGDLAEFTHYIIEFDFAIAGRPSFIDVWGEQNNVPFFGDVRIGQFRQPTSMDAWTSVRHLDFLERNAAFQALDPFRRVGIMSHTQSDDELSVFSYSCYATGSTFWNPVTGATTYNTMGDTRTATQITDHGGVSFAARATRLLNYDDLADGRYLNHLGAGYNFSEIGGSGTAGPDARTYQARTVPEFFVGDPTGGGATAAGTPFVVDTGRFLANDYHYFHAEYACNYGAAHMQTEWLFTLVDQMGGDLVYYNGGYFQCGYFLTGESCGYNKQLGVMDYNVKPFTDFFSTGKNTAICGWGAWETAFRWSYLDLSATNIANYVSPSPTSVPPSPNPGILNESTLALNWWWNQYTRVQFNYIHGFLNNNATGHSDYNIFATRFQVEF